jgi:hypothetical protein
MGLHLYTLRLFSIAMEDDPFIDGLPIKNGDFPWLRMLNNLRRGDTKGSCVTGDVGDHSVRKPSGGHGGGAWTWPFRAGR